MSESDPKEQSARRRFPGIAAQRERRQRGSPSPAAAMSKSNDFWQAERDRIVSEYLAGLIDASHALLALRRLGYEGWEARDLLHMAAEDAFHGAER